ncbi:extracellular solute-binding protein [Sutterella sp.]|uniref:extracellular solute-binding protein n=1 Tax=Sutterella sp. TaxID=1981025 RepID=UPI003FD73029
MLKNMLAAGVAAAVLFSGAAVVSAAENSVTVYMPSPKGLNAKYVAAFEKETGIKVKLFEGTTGKILARLEAEKANPVADVVVLASWSDGLAVKKSGILAAYPQAKNVEKLRADFVDADRTLFGTSASAMGVIWNKTLIPELNADWKELADPKYKGQVAIPDPEKSGSCKDFLAGYLYATKGDWSAWEGMAKQGLAVAGANKAALESVLTGAKAVLVAGVDYNAYAQIKKGEPIGIYYPASGTVVNPRPAMILKSAKNPEGARAFVDFLLSDKAQNLVAQAYLLPGRTDVKAEGRLGLDEIKTFSNLDWNAMMKSSDAEVAKLMQMTKGNR